MPVVIWSMPWVTDWPMRSARAPVARTSGQDADAGADRQDDGARRQIELAEGGHLAGHAAGVAGRVTRATALRLSEPRFAWAQTRHSRADRRELPRA